jgi:type III restriction enzyme
VKRTELVTTSATDQVQATGRTIRANELRHLIADAILNSPIITARPDPDDTERKAITPILDAFFEGLNGGADELLSAYLERASAHLISLINAEQRRFASKVTYDQVLKVVELCPERVNTRPISNNRFGPFSRATAYAGWKKSIYALEWFDSQPERALANLLDDAAGVNAWLRLHTGELQILWSYDGRQYNADFIVVEDNRHHWVVEVKADKDLSTPEVQAKREAAKRWVNYVNVDERVDATWHYLLVSESDVTTSKGSWAALKRLGT